MHAYEDNCFVELMKSCKMAKELLMKRTRDSTFGLGDFNTSVRRMGGRQIHKLSLSGDCFKDFYSLDDEFPHPCHLNTNGFYSICVITI